MKNLTSLLAWTIIGLALTAIQSPAQSAYEPYAFTTLAGTGPGSADGTGSAARFFQPSGVAADSAGNVYVADSGNSTIRKVTPAGVVTTLAGLAGIVGSADGTGSAARFNSPSGLAVDSAGNVYVADTGNYTIRKVTSAGVVTTLAGLSHDANGDGYPDRGYANGTGSHARFWGPSGVAVDSAGNVYVADTYNDTIRKVTSAGLVTTLAGNASITNDFGVPRGGYEDGTGSAAQFWDPRGVAVDSEGNVYVADQGNHTIRKVTPAGVVTTLAGQAGSRGSADGTGGAARFYAPHGVAVDSEGNVYVVDEYSTIRKVTPIGVVTTLAGVVGGGGVAVDSAGNVYVADFGNGTIRKVTPTGQVTTLAGEGGIGSADGTQSDARFNGPSGVAVDSAGNVYVADSGNNTIRKVTPVGAVTTLAGLAGFEKLNGGGDGTGSDARFYYPQGVAVDSAGNVYVSEGGGTIRKVTPAGVVTTLAGSSNLTGVDGTGSDAGFIDPIGVAVDSAGNVYVADFGNAKIRKVTPAGVVTTLAGGFGCLDCDGGPTGVAIDGAGNLYVADTWSHTLRKVTPAGVVTSAAQFSYPAGVAVDSAGNVYVADNNTIRKVTPAGVVTTLAGLAGEYGNVDGTGSAARFNGARGVAVDSAGNVYVADQRNNTIRKGYPVVMVVNSGPAFGFNGGQFGFNLSGPMGRLVIIESSTDLVRWLPLWTNTFAGALNFSDPQTSVSSNRFYRARLP